MSSSDSDSGVLRRNSIWGPNPLRGGLYKKRHIPLNLHVQTPLNLTKPIDTKKKKQKKKKKAYWGESSSDEDYASGSNLGWGSDKPPQSGDSGDSTSDFGSGSDNDEKEKNNSSEGKTNAKVETDDEGYESPPPSSSMFGKAFSAAGSFLTSLPASAQKLRQRALGSTQKVLESAVAQATMKKNIDEVTESWKTASGSARANLAAQMNAAATDKPAESDPFSAQPIGAGAAGSDGSDNSHSSSSVQPAPASRPKSLKPLDPVEEAVKEKNLASQKLLADLAVEERAVKDLKARREQALQRALTVAQGTKAASSHARVTDLFSAAVKAGSHADQIVGLDAVLARVQEQQKDEKRKIEARELDPSIQTEAETDAESRSAAAASPRSIDIIGRWKEWLKESEPYQKAELFIHKMPIDAKLRMMTQSEYTGMMSQYQKEYDEFVEGEATKLRGNPRASASIKMAEEFWKNLTDYGWKHYQLEYERASKILSRALELERRYFEERKADREERRREKEASSQRTRLKELQRQAMAGMQRVRENDSQKKEPVSEVEVLTESEAESGSDAEPDFTKEAEEELVEEEVQEQLPMNPAVATITSRTLGQIPDALDLATYSQTLSKDHKLNPANAILVLKRLDDILAADSRKLSKKGLTRMPGFSIQATGKIVKTGKKSSYTSMKAVIVKRISELEKKQQAGSKASSSSSSSFSRSSGRVR